MTDLETSSSAPLSAVEKLTKSHEISLFDCGDVELNDWLKRYAFVNLLSDSAQTYVAHRKMRVIGYYSVSAGAVRPEESPARITKGLAKHPIGVILLARLAVEKQEQGQGLGQALLKDAFLRIASAADTVGARAVLVHAVNERARLFYEHFGFEPSPTDPLTLMFLMKDLRALLKTK
ncbi:MAG: GNAT family N-acetyltransferase [Elusimicrobia bacterium RIFCSPLOWO2_01_FULL_59_12]|nr:MAG: GNAT family N-acetyltransferase [Elusimicrobia bacterium RIFCSPLOWO2_01_FULL_59_12]